MFTHSLKYHIFILEPNNFALFNLSNFESTCIYSFIWNLYTTWTTAMAKLSICIQLHAVAISFQLSKLIKDTNIVKSIGSCPHFSDLFKNKKKYIEKWINFSLPNTFLFIFLFLYLVVLFEYVFRTTNSFKE